MGFGDRLRWYLDTLHISENQLSIMSGVPRGTIRSYLDYPERVPGSDILFAIAKALDKDPAALWAGDEISSPAPDTPEQLLEKLQLAQPVSIPVYEHFAIHAPEVREGPFEYVYLPRSMAARKKLEAYRLIGHCLEPNIHDGDIVIVDRDRPPQQNNILLCLVGDRLIIGRLEYTTGVAWLRNNDESVQLDDCRSSAVVIMVTRQLV